MDQDLWKSAFHQVLVINTLKSESSPTKNTSKFTNYVTENMLQHTEQLANATWIYTAISCLISLIHSWKSTFSVKTLPVSLFPIILSVRNYNALQQQPKATNQFPKMQLKHSKTPIQTQKTIMLVCKMLQTSLTDHQTINMVVNKQLLCIQ
jgi:hypothetical protein